MLRAGNFLNKKKATYIAVAIFIILIAGAFFYKQNHKNTNTQGIANESPPQAQINSFKDAKTLTDKRTLAAAYEQNGQYNDSEAIWQAIASQSKQIIDYWALLNICATHQVSDRPNCINSTTSVLKSKTSKMDFQTAYAIGELLETNGNGKLAIPFYQRALAVYSPPQNTGATFPSKVQLQDKINEL